MSFIVQSGLPLTDTVMSTVPVPWTCSSGLSLTMPLIELVVGMNVVNAVLRSHLGDYTFNRLSQFFSFHLILSNHFRLQTVRRFSMRTLTYLTPFTISQTCVCLMANLVLLNLTLFLTVHFCAVHGNAATHMHITYVSCFSILPPTCSCIMPLISIMPALDSIGRFGTNMYIPYDSI